MDTGMVYHVMTRSIAGFRIFGKKSLCKRILEGLRFYQQDRKGVKLSRYLRNREELPEGRDLVRILGYCVMPTHLHLILEELEENALPRFMANVLISYSRYFNRLHNRKGPLWEGRFRKVPVETDEQLLHLTRYIHLNPVTAGLADQPGDWTYSSYNEYLGRAEQGVCSFNHILSIDPDSYRGFVEEYKDQQIELAGLKAACQES